jgi:hypothetical protein
MKPLMHDLPAGQLIERLTETAEPVVERVNVALGRSSRRSTKWPWVLVGIFGIVTVVVLVSRRRAGGDVNGEVIEHDTARVAS